MNFILGWLWNNKGLALAGVIAVVGLLYVGSLKVMIHNRDAKIEAITASNVSVTAELEVQKQTNARLVDSLRIVTEEGKRKQANAAMWKTKFDASEKEVQARLGGLVSWLPTLKETDCESAKRLLHDYRTAP